MIVKVDSHDFTENLMIAFMEIHELTRFLMIAYMDIHDSYWKESVILQNWDFMA